jgi:hypothetical protein
VDQQTILDLRKEVEDLKAHIKNPMAKASKTKTFKMLMARTGNKNSRKI